MHSVCAQTLLFHVLVTAVSCHTVVPYRSPDTFCTPGALEKPRATGEAQPGFYYIHEQMWKEERQGRWKGMERRCRLGGGGRKRQPAGPPPACTHIHAADCGVTESHTVLLLLVWASKSSEHEKAKAESVLEKPESTRTACTLLLLHATHSPSTHWVSGAQRVVSHLEKNIAKAGVGGLGPLLKANTTALIVCTFPWGPLVDAHRRDLPLQRHIPTEGLYNAAPPIVHFVLCLLPFSRSHPRFAEDH